MIISSGLKGASAAIYAGRCKYWGAKLVCDTSKEPTLKIWDNATEGSGTVIDFLMGSDETHADGGMNPNFVRCFNGIYAQLSAEEGDYVVYYEVE